MPSPTNVLVNLTSTFAAAAAGQLRRAESLRLSSDGDRRIHGLATTAFRALAGVTTVVVNRLDDHEADSGPAGWIFWSVYAVVTLGLVLWQTRVASTVPRHARRISYLGLAATLVSSVAANIVLNTTDDPGPGLLVALMVLAGAPLLAAGLLILRGGRR